MNDCSLGQMAPMSPRPYRNNLAKLVELHLHFSFSSMLFVSKTFLEDFRLCIGKKIKGISVGVMR